MDVGHHLLWIVTVPALTAGTGGVLWVLLKRYHQTLARPIIPIMMGVGFLVAFYGFHDRLFIPPRLTFHWLPIVALAASLAACLYLIPVIRKIPAWVGYYGCLLPLAILAAYGSLPSSLMTSLPIMGAILLPLLMAGVIDLAGPGLRQTSVPVWAFVAFSATGICLLFFGSARMAQLSGIIPCMILGVSWILWKYPDVLPSRAWTILILPVFGSFLIIGTHSVSLSPIVLLLLAGSAGSLGLARLRWRHGNHPLVVFLVTALMGGVAVLLSWRMNPGLV